MRGCLLRLFLLPLIIALLYPLFCLRQPLPTFVFLAEGAEVAAVIAGLFLWFAVQSLMDIRRFSESHVMVNQTILRDGERAVVSGRLASEASPLKAPFSGQECVGYHYEVSHVTRGPKSKIMRWIDYEGYALIPTILKSSLGDLKILSESDKELFYEIPFVTLENDSEQFGSYLNKIDFAENVSGPGDFRVDKMIGSPPDLDTCTFKEKLIKSDDTVLAEGVYSSDQGGITPDPDRIIRPFHLIPGGEAGLRKKIRSRRISAVVGAGLGCATFVIYFLMN